MRFLVFGVLLAFSVNLWAQEVIPVDENLVVFVSDVHIAEKPLVRWALPMETERGKTIDYQYEKRGIDGEYRYEIDTQAFLRQLVADVLALNPRPACVIMLGDDAQGVNEEDYIRVRELIQPWKDAGIPVVKIMGNHDHHDITQMNQAYINVFPETLETSISPSPNWMAFKVSLPAVDFLVLETFDPLRNRWEEWFSAEQKEKYANNENYLRFYGAFLPEQREWLIQKMKEQPTDRPLVLCGHHPVDFDAFLPEYRDFPQVQCWVHGHFHAWYMPKDTGIRALSLPSGTTLAVGKFLTPPAFVKLNMLPEGWRFTLQTLDTSDPKNGSVYFIPKHIEEGK